MEEGLSLKRLHVKTFMVKGQLMSTEFKGSLFKVLFKQSQYLYKVPINLTSDVRPLRYFTIRVVIGKRVCKIVIKTVSHMPVSRLRSYLKENWGAPFIAGFMLLLIAAAVSVSSSLADYSYYALIAGVALQVICFLKYRSKNEAQENI